MRTNVPKKDDTLSTNKTPRIPIPITPEEEKQLICLAAKDSRSKQAMAGIIYRLGLKEYVKGVVVQQ
jgi:hypothetical protein